MESEDKLAKALRQIKKLQGQIKDLVNNEEAIAHTMEKQRHMLLTLVNTLGVGGDEPNGFQIAKERLTALKGALYQSAVYVQCPNEPCNCPRSCHANAINGLLRELHCPPNPTRRSDVEDAGEEGCFREEGGE